MAGRLPAKLQGICQSLFVGAHEAGELLCRAEKSQLLGPGLVRTTRRDNIP